MIAILFFCCTILSAIPNNLPKEPPVRLMLFAQSIPQSINISSNTPCVLTITTPEKKILKQIDQKRVIIRANNGKLLVGSISALSLTIEGERMILRLEKRKREISGRVEITPQSNQLMIVATITEQQYLAKTLASETTSGEPFQYLIALSVLQRNYLRTHRNRHQPYADLCDNTHCQRSDNTHPSKTIKRAVALAKNIQLMADTAYPCYYSANCGGQTLTPQHIWNSNELGYSTVTCNFCKQGKWNRWTRTTMATPEVERLVQQTLPPPFINDDFKIAIGRVIGFNVVLSNTVDRIERREGKFWFSGRGFGHRVGLCCDGAITLAKRGKSAAEILRTYFPDAWVRSTAAN